MYKLPKTIKKKVSRLKKEDSALWSLEQLRKDNAKFTKEAKLIRRVLLKHRINKRKLKQLL